MANACVYRFRYRGEEWTVKDFSTRPWWVRKILAPYSSGANFELYAGLRVSRVCPAEDSGWMLPLSRFSIFRVLPSRSRPVDDDG